MTLVLTLSHKSILKGRGLAVLSNRQLSQGFSP
jgi:hypothetical protein